jgi:hypothetical protein
MLEGGIATANTNSHQWGKSPSETLEWDVLVDGELINLGMPAIA